VDRLSQVEVQVLSAPGPHPPDRRRADRAGHDGDPERGSEPQPAAEDRVRARESHRAAGIGAAEPYLGQQLLQGSSRVKRLSVRTRGVSSEVHDLFVSASDYLVLVGASGPSQKLHLCSA
jgi:hypothetical protein